MGHGQTFDHMMMDGLENAYDGKAMGCFAQDTADSESITREQMDEFAVSSLTKAQEAINTGTFKDEIVPVTISTRRGEVTVDTVAHATNAIKPEDFTVAPVGAVEKVLAKAGWSAADVDLYEINEAFAMVTMLGINKLGLDSSKVNIKGGACALGHPIGASGARIVVTLLHALKQKGLKKGVAALCIGGGEGTALAVEML
jgi:acetyl-CoA C-acetyltransferase